MKYKPGDKVKIKDDISQHPCTETGMLKWQGKTMTVREVRHRKNDLDLYRMTEDTDEGPLPTSFGWRWYEGMIEDRD